MKMYRLKDEGLERAIMRITGRPQGVIRKILHNAAAEAHERGLCFATVPELADDRDEVVHATISIGLTNFKEVEAYKPDGWNDASKVELLPDTDYLVRLSDATHSIYVAGKTDRKGRLQIGNGIMVDPEDLSIHQSRLTLVDGRPAPGHTVFAREIGDLLK